MEYIDRLMLDNVVNLFAQLHFPISSSFVLVSPCPCPRACVMWCDDEMNSESRKTKNRTNDAIIKPKNSLFFSLLFFSIDCCWSCYCCGCFVDTLRYSHLFVVFCNSEKISFFNSTHRHIVNCLLCVCDAIEHFSRWNNGNVESIINMNGIEMVMRWVVQWIRIEIIECRKVERINWKKIFL